MPRPVNLVILHGYLIASVCVIRCQFVLLLSSFVRLYSFFISLSASNFSLIFFSRQSVLDGYNGTVMAYGQTGTGKTYTLGRLGEEDTADRGIMVRAMEDILAEITPANDSVSVSFFQVVFSFYGNESSFC